MTMEEPMIRGHVLEQTARFYRASYDPVTISRIEGELSIELKAALEAMSSAGWYPRRYQVELLNALAAVRGPSDATYGDLVRCGAALAEPSNSFTSLLLHLMTPELFVRKLPRFWARDHKSSGAFEIEPAGDGRGARVRLRGVKHYDHGAVLWLGFLQGVLERVGAAGASVRQEGWSWSSPGPEDVAYEVRWS